MNLRYPKLLIVLAAMAVGLVAIWMQYGDAFRREAKPDFVSLETHYFETTTHTLNGERRLAVSLRAGSVDFLVLIHGDNRGYPRYVGGAMGKEVAEGYILGGPLDQRMEVTNTGKAYQISDGRVQSVDFSHRLSAREVSELVSALGDDYSLERVQKVMQALREVQ